MNRYEINRIATTILSDIDHYDSYHDMLRIINSISMILSEIVDITETELDAVLSHKFAINQSEIVCLHGDIMIIRAVLHMLALDTWLFYDKSFANISDFHELYTDYQIEYHNADDLKQLISCHIDMLNRALISIGRITHTKITTISTD